MLELVILAALASYCNGYPTDWDVFPSGAPTVHHRPFEELSRAYIRLMDGILEHLQMDEFYDWDYEAENCREDTKLLVKASSNNSHWALAMLDSMGKPSSSILEGSVTFPGTYSECVEVKVREDKASFGGQYCLVSFQLAQQVMLQKLPRESSQVLNQKATRMGFCLPSSCSVNHLIDAANKSAVEAMEGIVNEAVCSTGPSSIRSDTAAIAVIAIFSTVAFVVLLGTSVDVWKLGHERRWRARCYLQVADWWRNLREPKSSPTAERASGRVSIESSSTRALITPEPGPVTKPILEITLLNGVDSRYQSREPSPEIQKSPEPASRPLPESTEHSPDGGLTHSSYSHDEYGPITASNIFRCLSIRVNGLKILSLTPQTDTISCLHGMRFYSMIFIIFGHTYSFGSQWLFFRNRNKMEKAPMSFVAQTFTNMTLAVDSFFFISGFLACYKMVLYYKRDKKTAIPTIYLHRYLRLTPLLMAVIAFCATIMRHIASGPDWMRTIVMYDEWCKDNWWLNLFYLNNFINSSRMCLGHTWYSAIEMQFFIVAVPLIYLWHKKGLMASGIVWVFLLLVNLVVTSVLTMIYDYPATPYINDVVPQDLMNSYYKNIYIKPYCRMGPYLVGIAAGLYMATTSRHASLRPRTIFLWWTVSIALNLTVLYSLWEAHKGNLPPKEAAAAYSALARTVWAGGLAWLTFACHTGRARFFNNLLSWRMLIPLSRLTYAAYLVHPVVICIFYGMTETTVDFSLPFMGYILCGNIMITYIVAYVVSLLFEGPILSLESIFTKRKFMYVSYSPRTQSPSESSGIASPKPPQERRVTLQPSIEVGDPSVVLISSKSFDNVQSASGYGGAVDEPSTSGYGRAMDEPSTSGYGGNAAADESSMSSQDQASINGNGAAQVSNGDSNTTSGYRSIMNDQSSSGYGGSTNRSSTVTSSSYTLPPTPPPSAADQHSLQDQSSRPSSRIESQDSSRQIPGDDAVQQPPEDSGRPPSGTEPPDSSHQPTSSTDAPGDSNGGKLYSSDAPIR